MEHQSTHERIAGDLAVRRSSNRSFGVTFGVVFMLVAGWPVLHGRGVRWWAVAIAALFVAAAVVAPRVLGPLNRLWFVFGLALNAVMGRVVMATLFFSTLTPIALVMRACGHDPLRLRRDPGAKTYWIDRKPPGPSAHTMTRQF